MLKLTTLVDSPNKGDTMNIFQNYASRYERTREEEYLLQEYLEICKRDRLAYASAAERMLAAIGEPELLDTCVDPAIAGYFPIKSSKSILPSVSSTGTRGSHRAGRRLLPPRSPRPEERKQVPHLLGPVGGGKSSIAEKLKALMGKCRFMPSRVRRSTNHHSDCSTKQKTGRFWKKTMAFPRRYLRNIMSPWAVKTTQRI